MSAREVRDIQGAQSEANSRLQVELAVTTSALDSTAAALRAAIEYITALEADNDKLRKVTAMLAGMGGTK
jgi:hypothetical protein